MIDDNTNFYICVKFIIANNSSLRFLIRKTYKSAVQDSLKFYFKMGIVFPLLLKDLITESHTLTTYNASSTLQKLLFLFCVKNS